MPRKSEFYKLNDDPTTLEVCLILFKKCNLNCQFCFQDRSGIDIDYIKELPVKLKEQLKILKEKHYFDNVIYRIWGGELFSDDISDNMFIEYQILVDTLKTFDNELNIKTKVCFTSNLVLNKVDRVINLLKNTDSILATSYDPIYRFHDKEQIELWENNVNLLKPETVSITLTSQNIQEYMNDYTHFNRLIGQTINLEYYIYNKKYEFFKPSEDELYDFYVYCFEHAELNIPEIQAISLSLDNPIGRYCSCNNSCLYIDGQITFDCLKRSSNLPKEEFFDVYPFEDEYTEKQLALALKRKNCVTCQNFSFCRMTCLASILHKSYDGSECALKRFYEYLRQHQW